MQFLRYRGPILSGTFVLAALLVGCNTGKKGDGEDLGAVPKPITGPGKASGPGQAIPPGKAVLRGKITVTGASPAELAQLSQEFVNLMNKEAKGDDKGHCVEKAPSDSKTQQDWNVGEGSGLGDVYVYLKAPSGSYFAIDPGDERVKSAREKPAVIDQPFCVYKPHAQKVLVGFRDKSGTEQKKVQKLLIKNTAKIGHNVKFPDGTNLPISSGVEKEFNTDESGDFRFDYRPITITCSIHPWMSANLLALDHPYMEVTGPNGEFVLKNLPKGKVLLYVWHGKAGYLNNKGGRGEEITLSEGEETVKNIEVPFQK